MTIRIESAVFSYARTPVLNDISFSVDTGNFCAILGSNGSGKTTFLKCINKLIELDSGSISIDGSDISELTHNEISKLVSYVPQEHDNIAPYSVLEMVVMGTTPHLGVAQTPSAQHYELARNTLASLDALHLENKFFNQISGGERQIVIIARSLVQQSPIIILDEPSNHLDFSRKALLLKLLKKVCIEQNKTIITTTHDPNLISSLADYVVMLKNGQIFYEGKPDVGLTSQNLSNVYDVNVGCHTTENGKVFFYSD